PRRLRLCPRRRGRVTVWWPGPVVRGSVLVALDDPFRWVLEGLLVHALGGLVHDVLPDRSGDRATVDLRVGAVPDGDPGHLVLADGGADPDGRGQLGGEPGEPGLLVVVGRPGLRRRLPTVLERHRRGGAVAFHRLREQLGRASRDAL